MFLTVNHSEGNNGGKKEFELIAEGKYQAIIKEAEVTKSSAGNDMIKITVVIRDDVRQQFAKRKLWDYIVPEKAQWKAQQVAKAVQIPDGTNINSIQDFAKNILFKPVTIDVKHEQETYNGETKTRERVSYYSVAEVPSTSAPADPFATGSTSNTSPF
jgi:hypothetical protein